MGFVTRAIGRQVASWVDRRMNTLGAQAAVERSKRVTGLLRVVERVAGSDLDDEAASARLREQLPEDRELVDSVVRVLADSRTSYLGDRGYRLLTSAVDGAPVRPIDPVVADQFLAERQLGRMSLSDAFGYLVSLERRIADELARRADEEDNSKRHSHTTGSGGPLFGPGAESPHVVMNTDLASEVVREYAAVTRNGRMSDKDLTPYFEREKQTSGVSFYFGVSRPRASN